MVNIGSANFNKGTTLKESIKASFVALALTGSLAVAGLGFASPAQAASRVIYNGNWEYGVSSAVNWTRFTTFSARVA